MATAGCLAILKTAFEEARASLEIFLFEVSAHISPHSVGAKKLGAVLVLRRRRIAELVQAKRLYVERNGIGAGAEEAYAEILRIETDIGDIAGQLTAAATRSEAAAGAGIRKASASAKKLIARVEAQIESIGRVSKRLESRSSEESPRWKHVKRTVMVVEVAEVEPYSGPRARNDLALLRELFWSHVALAKVPEKGVRLAVGDGNLILYFERPEDGKRYARHMAPLMDQGSFNRPGTRFEFRIGIAHGTVRMRESGTALPQDEFDPQSATVKKAAKLARSSPYERRVSVDKSFTLLESEQAKGPARREPAVPRPASAASQRSLVKPAPRRTPAKRESEPPIRILHLSDLHFDKDTDVQEHWHALEQDLKIKVVPPNRIDLVVISGDFRNKGCSRGFAKAKEFIDRLLATRGLTPQECIFVPGNHDITVEGDYYHVCRQKPSPPDPSFSEHGALWIGLDPERGKDRFQDYREFVKGYGVDYSRDYGRQVETRLFPGLGIQFIALNSCWNIGLQNLKGSGVSPEAVRHATEQAQAEATGPRPLRIGVWHHAVKGTEAMKDVTFVYRLLQNLDLDFVLHGDVHEVDRGVISHPSSSKAVAVVGCGALGAEAAGRPESTPQIYNIIEIDRDHGGVQVHVRQRANAQSSWTSYAAFLDPGATTDAYKRDNYRFDLRPRKPGKDQPKDQPKPGAGKRRRR